MIGAGPARKLNAWNRILGTRRPRRRRAQKQVAHYAGQRSSMAITFAIQTPAAARQGRQQGRRGLTSARERPPLREGAAPVATKWVSGIPGPFWQVRRLDGNSSRGRSNTSRPLTQSAYQLVGGHAPSGRCAFSYSYTESLAMSCRGQPDAAADTCCCVKMGCVALLSELERGTVG